MRTYTLSTARDAGPLYRQLCDALREDIRAGRVAADAQLPSKRALAAQLGVSVLTVETAYAQLLSEGWIYARAKSGHFATPLAAAAPGAARRTGAAGTAGTTGAYGTTGMAGPATSPTCGARAATEGGVAVATCGAGEINLAGGVPAPDFFPFSAWAKIVRRILSARRAELLAPTPPGGAPALREAIAAHLRDFRGMDVDPARVFVAAGSETLYAMLVRALGTARPWAVENPGHKTIAAVYRQCGATVRPVPVDGAGMAPDALARSGAAVAHLSPAHQYPTGVAAPAARRYEWLAWAARAEGRTIVEDDYDSELRVAGLPLPTLQSLDAAGRVVHLETFSRALAPTLRVGCMVVPDALAPRFDAVFSPLSCTVPNLVQLALADFLAEGHFARHLARTRTRCRLVRAELLAALRDGPLAGRATVSEERAGPHLVLALKTRRPAAALAARAAALGLRVRPLASFYDGPVPREAAGRLVLDYSALPPGRAAKAVARLARL